MHSEAARRIEGLAALLAFAGALAVRVVPFADDVFRAEGVAPWRGPDVYYHLHRIEVGARNWPRFPEHDMWRNYPDGAYSLWSPLFDLVPATFSAVTGIAPVQVGVVWPALLGALAVFPLLDILRRLHGRAAWLGVGLYVVLPGAVSFAALGRADHHVGEVLMHLLVYALTLRALIRLGEGEVPGRARAIGLGLVMGLSLWMWRGSLVFLAVPATAALLLLVTTRDGALRREASRFWMLAFGVAVLTILPYALLNVVRGRAPVSAYFLSLLQPAVLLVWMLLVPVAAQVGDSGLRPGPLLRGRVGACVAGIGLTLALVADGLLAGTAFLTRTGDAWTATIVESRPLWSGGLPTHYVIEQLGFMPVLLLPIALALGIALLRRRPLSPALAFTALALLFAIAMVFLQVRFTYYAAPVVAAVPGGLWVALRSRAVALRVVCVAFALLLLLPTARFWAPAFDGNPRTGMAPPQMEPWLVQLLAELAERTPVAGDVHDPVTRPAYCVLAPWSLGNFIQTLSERAVLASSGGAHETAAYEDTRAFQDEITDEVEAVRRMLARGCRYAITEYVHPGSEPPGRAATLFARRLHAQDGSDADGVAGSGRFRWLFESRDPARSGPALYKVFQLVEGAALRLPAGAAKAVVTRIGSAARPVIYRRQLTALGDGQIGTRVSQPGRYRIVDGGGQVLGSVEVTEAAVLGGRTLVLAAGQPPSN